MIVATHLFKMLHHVRYSVKTYQNHHPSSLLLFSINYTTRTTNQCSCAVSYLINSCGLSPESALSVSKHVNFKTPDKPDLVLSFLKKHGFSKTHISDLVRRVPSLLLSDPEKTFLPKFEFFYSKGVSSTDLAVMSSGYPLILKRSLENQIIPNYNFFMSLIKSDERTIIAIKRCLSIIYHNPEDYVIPNIKVLQNNKVPESNIVMLLQDQPRAFMMKSVRFNQIVEDVKAMGFNPSKFCFLVAIRVMRGISKSTWERKVDVYRQWGWSKDETLAAFRKFPLCMCLSENKIMAAMDYFVNKMGMESLAIAKCPTLLSYSLKKRIVPRCSVIQVLLSKGLINSFSLASYLKISEKLFLQKHVTRYEDQAPDLLKLYQEKMDLANKQGMGLEKESAEVIEEQI